MQAYARQHHRGSGNRNDVWLKNEPIERRQRRRCTPKPICPPSSTSTGPASPGKRTHAVPNAHRSRLSHVHALFASGHAFNHDWRRSKSLANACQHRRGSGNQDRAAHLTSTPYPPLDTKAWQMSASIRRSRNRIKVKTVHALLPLDTKVVNQGHNHRLPRHGLKSEPKPGKRPPASEGPGIETTFGLPIERRQRPRSTPKPRRPSSTLREVPVTDRRATSTVKAHTTYHTRVCHDYGLEGVL